MTGSAGWQALMQGVRRRQTSVLRALLGERDPARIVELQTEHKVLERMSAAPLSFVTHTTSTEEDTTQ